MLNREVVEKLGELLAKATPGPWRCTDGPVGYQHRVSSDDADGETVCDVERTGADAALIAAAVNALPELLRVYRAWLDAPYGLSEHIVDGLVYVRGDAITAAIHNGGDDEYVSVRLVRDGDSGEG